MIFPRFLTTALLLLLFVMQTTAQKYVAKEGYVSFFSEAPIENIKAENKRMTSIFIADNGMIAFSVINKDFIFPKKLMQEHFNDKYMESHKYPQSTFSGTIVGYSLEANGLQSVRAKGQLKIHGITKNIDIPGTLEVKGNTVQMKSRFKVVLADYGITIPAILWKNISEQVEVSIDLIFTKQ